MGSAFFFNENLESWNTLIYIYAARVFQLQEVLEKNIFWINMLAYMHAMINPVIYITLNEKFRQEFTKAVFLGKTESKSMLYFKKQF